MFVLILITGIFDFVFILISSSFSGDTLPTENLVRAGRDATLLIHEASMADDEAELAQLKAHSTFGQAIDIGRR